MGTALFHEQAGIQHRLFGRGITEERHVGDQQGIVEAVRYTLRVIEHILHRHRQRGLFTLYHHTERVADQYDIDARLLQQLREAGIIGCQAGDLLAILLHLREPTYGYFLSAICLRTHGLYVLHILELEKRLQYEYFRKPQINCHFDRREKSYASNLIVIESI